MLICILFGCSYGVATISRLLKIKNLFCRIQSLLYGSFAEETYNFKEPTNRSHPIFVLQRTSHLYLSLGVHSCKCLLRVDICMSVGMYMYIYI